MLTMGLRALVAGLFRFLDELARLEVNPDLEPRAWRRESPESAMRTAARRLGLSHARGRVWGELRTFVSAGLVDGWGTCVVAAKFRRSLELGLEILDANDSASDRSARLRPVTLKPSIADRLRAYAREPEIAREMLARDHVVRSLQALTREGRLTIDDDRIELTIGARDISSRAVVIALREASSLAYELRRVRTESPRSDHEDPVRRAWSRQASARGGHFDAASEVLTFDSVAGAVRMSIEGDDDEPGHGWSTSIVLSFKRPLAPVPASADSRLAELENLAGEVDLDPRHLRARVAHPLHDEDQLSKIIEAMVSTGAAIEQEAEAGRTAYR
jgi:hypothetical protein